MAAVGRTVLWYLISARINFPIRLQKESMMSNRSWRLTAAALAVAGALAGLGGPARAQTAPAAPTETSLGDLLAGTAVPHTVKLKDLTPEWRRMTVTGDAMLGMGGMMQSMMQSLGSMFGGGAAA